MKIEIQLKESSKENIPTAKVDDKKISSLNAELEKIKKTLNDKTTDIESIRLKLGLKEKECERLTLDLKEARTKGGGGMGEEERLREKCSKLERKRDKDLMEMEGEMKLLRDDVEKSRRHINQAENTLKETNKANESYNKQIISLNADFHKTISELEKYKKKFMELENKLAFTDGIEFKVKKLAEEAERWKKKFNDLDLETNAKTSGLEKKVQ